MCAEVEVVTPAAQPRQQPLASITLGVEAARSRAATLDARNVFIVAYYIDKFREVGHGSDRVS